MADIFDVADTLARMADGFEGQVLDCLEANSDVAEQAVREQLWGGLSGDDSQLSPNYDNDPYFNEDGFWKGRNADYKAWKAKITPPSTGWMLNVPPRPANVPNLFIDGTFYSRISARMNGDALSVRAEGGDSADIVAKWGEDILRIGSLGIQHFSDAVIGPWIWDYFEKCGW